MKTQLSLLCIVTLMSLFSYGHENPLTASGHKSTKVEQADLKIYLLGGIVSAISQKEIDFSKKYHVLFLDFGCVPPSNLEYYERLNFKAFDLLNIQFGPKWQEELKPTTLGFSKWKEKQ